MSAAQDARAPVALDTLAAAALALVVTAWVSSSVSGFTTDSDAYLDVAANFRAGRGLVQTVVDFWRPGMPDPLGLWPPLYPVLVAIVAAFGVPLEPAALGVSGASFVLFAAAFHRLAARLLARPLAAAVTALALTTLGVAACSAHAWSEATYLALLAGGILAGSRLAEPAPGAGAREEGGSASRGRAFVAGALFGAAALTRYAGVPLALTATALVAAGPRTRRLAPAFALGALGPPALWIARDLALFGRPFGPALPASAAGPLERAAELARALRWEVLPAPFDSALSVAAVALALLAAGVALALLRPWTRTTIAATALVSLAVVWIATSTSAINSPGGRYTATALPFLWLAGFAGLAPLVARPRARAVTIVAGLLVAALVVCAARDLALWGLGRPSRAVAALGRRDDRLALSALAPPGRTPVLSDRGHALRLATGRPAVQIPPAAYRPRTLDAADLARWKRRGVTSAIVVAGEEAESALLELGARPDSARGRFVRLVLP
jgi:hypothetical protein